MDELSSDQQIAYDKAQAFLHNPNPPVPYFTIFGLAGTGKTHVLAKIGRERPTALMCSFTGKAASVLRARTGLDVSTVHSAIYDYKGHAEDDKGEQKPIFISKEADFGGKLILLDECSTVGERLAEELLATNARVIACGDPGQLPPVKDRIFFDKPDTILTKPHRQALESAIIRQAHFIRNKAIYKGDGDDFVVIPKSDLRGDLLRFGGIALCWRNETRRRLNVSRRKANGITGNIILAGEPIMVLRNDHRLGVYNGATYEVACKREPGEDLQIIDYNGRKIMLINATCEGIDPGFEDRRNVEDWSPVTLAYATTVHKSQGSEWNDVMVIDEYNQTVFRREWLYTAVTRAAKRVLVVQV